MSRFNLRNRPRISYYEPDEPNLDEYVFCTDCGDFVYEFCSIHGPLLIIPDDKPPTESPFPPCVPRAALTIPHVFLHIAPSRIPDAGLGVFSTLALPSGVRFGPYVGKKTVNITSMYCWQINDKNNKSTYLINAEDPNESNWMRYVNCSRHWGEQNLIAYQYRGQLYYRTIKIIPRFTELLVFYGSEFAHMLQIDLKRYNAPTSYAEKFGAPPHVKYLALVSEVDETSLPTNIITQKPTESSQNIIKETKFKDNNSKVLQDNDKVNVDKEHEPDDKKVKYKEDEKKTEKDKKNILKTKCATKSTALVSKNTIRKQNYKNICENENASSNKTNLNGNINRTQETDVSKKLKNYIQNIFTCDLCSFRTSIEKYLITHLLTHKYTNKYTCNVCGYITQNKSHLKRHLRIHTGEKPYTCDHCEQKFKHKSSLNRHIRTHTGEKPYACEHCERKFNEKSSLNKHIRTHTGEKPYACEHCERKFNEKFSLNKHIRTHTGEKPYACEQCERKFARKDVLNYHTKKHLI